MTREQAKELRKYLKNEVEMMVEDCSDFPSADWAGEREQYLLLGVGKTLKILNIISDKDFTDFWDLICKAKDDATKHQRTESDQALIDFIKRVTTV